LVKRALEISNSQQRALLSSNYGRKSADAEKKVKQLYIELALEQHYKGYEAKSIPEIEGLINKIDENMGLKRAVLIGFLDTIICCGF
jgi:farnesyl diphosphate synthase